MLSFSKVYDDRPGEYGEEVPGVALVLEDVAERLDEPGASGRVAPAVETGNGAEIIYIFYLDQSKRNSSVS